MVTRTRRLSAFTILELVIALTMIGILASIGVSSGAAYVERARMADVVVSMKTVEKELSAYLAESGILPETLTEIGLGGLQDPWGNSYQYTNLQTAKKGKARKDKFLVPINSDYDLWSMGPDGKSVAPLTAKSSRDDIIRANDGAFYGLASAY